MKTEEYGKENDSIIVMLHGANFVHSYGRQYVLSDRYHIIVPHIMGFGDEAHRTFDTDACVSELADYIKKLDKKVLLVGFSLGGQLAFKLLSEHEKLFYAAIIVSPWLNKENAKIQEVLRINENQFASFKKKWLCHLIGMINGLPSKQRKEFAEQMQNVKLETIRNSVDNKITFDSVPAFSEVSVPIIALAGGKEQQEVKDSVKKMSELNSHCKYEIWEKAAHNIPPIFAKKFNEIICSMAK
ncbi:MAG: alpha/beta fold hydrolase [Ruminococcus sp.]|nr:alpha/beta fold hydrolase [Ruminococcus sp.]